MELKDIFAICAKLKYPENKLLYEYFDAVTFVDSVDEFLAATFEYLANLDDTNTSQIFRSFLYDNLILHIIQQHKISKPYQPKKLTIIPNASEYAKRAVSGQSKIKNPCLDYFEQACCNRSYDEVYQTCYTSYWQDNEHDYFTKPVFSVTDWLDYY